MRNSVVYTVCVLGALLGFYLVISGLMKVNQTWSVYENKLALKYDENEPRKLYRGLIERGYRKEELAGGEDEFVAFMSSDDNRKNMYDWISEQEDRPFNLGGYSEYEYRMKVAYGDIRAHGEKEYAMMNSSGANEVIMNSYISIGIGVLSVFLSLFSYIYYSKE